MTLRRISDQLFVAEDGEEWHHAGFSDIAKMMRRDGLKEDEKDKGHVCLLCGAPAYCNGLINSVADRNDGKGPQEIIASMYTCLKHAGNWRVEKQGTFGFGYRRN